MCEPDLVVASFLIMVQMDYVDRRPALERTILPLNTMQML
jgi:hypothetical protein